MSIFHPYLGDNSMWYVFCEVDHQIYGPYHTEARANSVAYVMQRGYEKHEKSAADRHWDVV